MARSRVLTRFSILALLVGLGLGLGLPAAAEGEQVSVHVLVTHVSKGKGGGKPVRGVADRKDPESARGSIEEKEDVVDKRITNLRIGKNRKQKSLKLLLKRSK